MAKSYKFILNSILALQPYFYFSFSLMWNTSKLAGVLSQTPSLAMPEITHQYFHTKLVLYCIVSGVGAG